MKIEDNIDQLLSSRMEGCQIEAPEGLWESIRSELPSQLPSDGGASMSGKIFGSIKSVSFGVKVALVSGGLAIGSLVVYMVNDSILSEPKSEMVQSKASDNELLEEPSTEESAKELTPSKAPLVQTEFKQRGKATIENPEKIEEFVKQYSSEPNEMSETGMPDLPIPSIVSSEAEPKKPEVKVEPENESIETESVIKDEPASKEDFSEKHQPKFYNFISPNGDGKNDTWFVDIEEVSDFHLIIYNSSGVLVFETNKSTDHWKGEDSKTGMICEVGRYVFVLNYKLENDTKFTTKQGTIMLFR